MSKITLLPQRVYHKDLTGFLPAVISAVACVDMDSSGVMSRGNLSGL